MNHVLTMSELFYKLGLMKDT